MEVVLGGGMNWRASRIDEFLTGRIAISAENRTSRQAVLNAGMTIGTVPALSRRPQNGPPRSSLINGLVAILFP